MGVINGVATRWNSPEYLYAYSGGIVGESIGSISECYNSGEVYAFDDYASEQSYCGGICAATNGTIINCFNHGSVFSNSYYASAGGIVAYADVESFISNSYNTGLIYGEKFGGIIGINTSEKTVLGTYTYEEIKGVGKGRDYTTTCSYEELCIESTFDSFDFSQIWTLKKVKSVRFLF